MTLRDTALLIRNLKGAPATVLLMMLGLGRPTGRDELVMLTTYSEHTVTKALQQLEFLGLAQNHARYNGWILTAHVRRRLLPAASVEPEEKTLPVEREPPSGAAGEGQTLPLPAASRPAGERQTLPLAGDQPAPPSSEGQTLPLPSSSSYSQEPSRPKKPSPQPTTTDHHQTRAGPPAVIDADAQAAVELLHSTGCPVTNRAGKGARETVQAALDAGWTGARIRACVRGWFAYAETAQGEGIKHKGFFTLAKLRQREEPPEQLPPPPTPDQVARDYIAAAYDRLVGR